MDSFTILDAIVALVVTVSALLAYARGVVREVLAIAGWVSAAVVAFLFTPQAEPLMQELPVVGEFLAGSCELSIIAAFTTVFAIALIIVSFFVPLFSSVVRKSALGGVDRGLGFLFGAARGVLLIAIAFFVYNAVNTGPQHPTVEQSRSAAVFAQLNQKIEDANPENALGWITDRYELLVGSCGAA
jgi:membrane protein required for colicin V production